MTLRAFDRSLYRLGLDYVDPTLQAIADAHDRTIGQAVLRWPTQRGSSPSPRRCIPSGWRRTSRPRTSTSPTRTWAEIASLDTGETQFFDHHDPEWIRNHGTLRID